jgi:hypothetical protein
MAIKYNKILYSKALKNWEFWYENISPGNHEEREKKSFGLKMWQQKLDEKSFPATLDNDPKVRTKKSGANLAVSD